MPRSRAAVLPADAPIEGAVDSRLVRLAVSGDRSAFEAIFNRYHQELYRYCLAIVRSREDAEDALQTTMAAALRSLPGEKRDLALRPWLFRVAHNESISLLRARSNTGGEEEPNVLPQASAASELEGRERLRQLVADLQALPDRQRSAIVMRELSDLSYAEIGSALESSEAAARQTVYEARSALFAFQEGREMECDRVREAVSADDRRRLRGRKVRAHLHTCQGCADFESMIAQRRKDLQVLFPPLPAVAAGGLLAGLLGGSSGATVAGAGAVGAGVSGAGASLTGLIGSGLAGSAAIKGISLIAAAALVAGAADVGGLIDLPNPVAGKGDRSREDAAPAGSAGSDRGSPAEPAAGSREETPEAASQSPANPAPDSRTKETAEAGGRGAGDAAAPATAHAGNPGAASGDSGAPGNSGSAPGHSDTSPGNSGSAPGQSGDQGNSQSAPGQSGASPGNSGSAPGHSGGSPGNSGSAPGHTGSAGNSGSAPGHTGSPGNSGSAPGQNKPGGGNSNGTSSSSSVAAVPESPGKPIAPPKPAPPEAGSAAKPPKPMPPATPAHSQSDKK